MTTFKDQIVVVTGASSGIGKALTLALAKQGAVLCLIGRNLEVLQSVATHARDLNKGEVLCCKTDLMVDEDIKTAFKRIQKSFRDIDILIHSAGSISMGRLETASIDELDNQYRINVRAPYLLTQMLLPLLRPHQGQIVFINSSAGINASANTGQYASTKHALKAIADSFRQELNADGLRVLSVYPGRTATPMQESVHRMEGREYHPERLMQPEDVAEAVINALGLPRSAEVTDIMIRPFVKS